MMNTDWARLLENDAKLKEAVGSIGIEGTVISVDQARAVTKGETDIVVGEKERREFEAYYASLDSIREHLDKPLTQSLLLKLHETVTRGDAKATPGRIRTDQRSIRRKGKIVFTPPPPDVLEYLLRKFIEWFNSEITNKPRSAVISAAICHFWFVWIHPFCDGNGRVGRLLTTLLLLKRKEEGVRYFALSDYYNNHADEYYDALEAVNVCDPSTPSLNFVKDLTSWIRFFACSYLEQMSVVREITNRILQLNIRVDRLRKKGMINDGHEKVLSFLSSRERGSYQELQKHLGVTSGRVSQILKPLREAQILVEETIGRQKWFMLGAPDEEPDETVLKSTLKPKAKVRKKVSGEKTMKQAVLPIFEQ